MPRIVDAGERLAGRRNEDGIPTSGGPNDVLKRIWRRPDFALEARSGRTTPERAALFEAVYRNIATRPAPLAIEGMPDDAWPLLWRASVATLKSIWSRGEGDHLAEIRRLHDETVVALVGEDMAEVAPLGTGRVRRGSVMPSHGLDLHPAFAAAAQWLPRTGWPGETRLTFDDCYGVVRTQEAGQVWWQPVSIQGRTWTRIGSGERHGGEEDAGRELLPLVSRMMADRDRDARLGLSGKALGPGGVRVGPPNPRRTRRAVSQDLVDALGMKGVEFGRGISQKERQEVCDLAFDAFFDLCQVLRLPAAAASLWGRAGIAFGSRGLGPGVLGHFEPQAFVVHMDGWNGAGVLAHEMGHAVDCMLAEACGLGRCSYLSEGVAAGWRDHTIARMMVDVIGACLKDRNGAPTTFLLDSRAQDAKSGGRYWSSPVEMFARAFETWVHDALAGRRRRNDFLVSRQAGENVTGLEWRVLSSVYPKGSERRRIVYLMDEFLKAAMPIAEGRLSGDVLLRD
jgi:hypothetical protein